MQTADGCRKVTHKHFNQLEYYTFLNSYWIPIQLLSVTKSSVTSQPIEGIFWKCRMASQLINNFLKNFPKFLLKTKMLITKFFNGRREANFYDYVTL